MNISFHCTHAGNTVFGGIASHKGREREQRGGKKAANRYLSRHGLNRKDKRLQKKKVEKDGKEKKYVQTKTEGCSMNYS